LIICSLKTFLSQKVENIGRMKIPPTAAAAKKVMMKILFVGNIFTS
jgi:hypothetical protein